MNDATPDIQNEGQNNTIKIGTKVAVTGSVKGSNNTVSIADSSAVSQIKLTMHGDNNRVEILGGRFQDAVFDINGNDNVLYIGDHGIYKRTRIRIGNHIPAHRVTFSAGDQVTMEPGCNFLLFNSLSSVRIGQDCMLSTGITFRCGESPHLIFDEETGRYLDTHGSIVIGDHCWIGERAYLTKRAQIASNSIVAACSVVTRSFEDENCVLAGNPARVAKRKVKWVRNRNMLRAGDPELASLNAFNDIVTTED